MEFMKQPFKNNTKVKQAKRLLDQALRSYQENIRFPRKAESRHKKSYKQRIDLIGRLRGTRGAIELAEWAEAKWNKLQSALSRLSE